MKNFKQEALLWFQVVTIFCIWVIILIVTKVDLRANNLLKTSFKIPDAITIFFILRVIFIKWAWRLPIFQGWLVPFPDLQGTWKGYLLSTFSKSYKDKIPTKVPVILRIKQSFDTICCVAYTEESTSVSINAQISNDVDSGVKNLSFIYSNRPKSTLRHRSPIHDGVVILKISNKPKRLLEGEYWTNRKTTGIMELEFKSKKLVEKFEKMKD